MNLPFTLFPWRRKAHPDLAAAEPPHQASLPPTALTEAFVPPKPGPAVAEADDELRWIENDGLLRDEGVLFGMSGGDITAKLATIEFYYARHIQQAERNCCLAQERWDTARQLVSEHQDRMQTRRREGEELHTQLALVPHEFARAFVGMSLYAGIIGLVYFLLYDWLKPYWPQHTALVVAGVYGFGMLSLFHRHSFLYSSTKQVAATTTEEPEATARPEAWKVMLEELGIPAVTALLAVVWGWPNHTAAQGLAMYLFLLFVFLYAGKAFLQNIVRVTAGARDIGANLLRRKWRRRRLRELVALLTADEKSLGTYTAEADRLEAGRDTLPDPEQVRLRCRAKQELFRSEYVLARESRGLLSLEDALSLHAFPSN